MQDIKESQSYKSAAALSENYSQLEGDVNKVEVSWLLNLNQIFF